MSTRCQIGLYSSKPTNIENTDILLYRHCDGYPGKLNDDKEKQEYGLLVEVVPFLKHFKNRRSLKDTSYLGAWLIHHMIESHLNNNTFVEIGKRDCLSYGICNKGDFHGDIDYFYAIYPNAIDVYSVNYEDDPKKWKIVNHIDL